MKDLLGLLDEMTGLLETAKTDARKGNASAGTRVRKAMQELKRKAQEARGLVLDARKK